MAFENWSAFWAMGGYALYVWASYAITALALGLTLLQPLRRRKALFAELQRQRRRSAGEAMATVPTSTEKYEQR
ncbi:MAG: heme exporter protein CcmD [Gammaproteobacteria bacterium]|nr:heme exporter protein CcmD [Gammaproteobacteria bacterium]